MLWHFCAWDLLKSCLNLCMNVSEAWVDSPGLISRVRLFSLWGGSDAAAWRTAVRKWADYPGVGCICSLWEFWSLDCSCSLEKQNKGNEPQKKCFSSWKLKKIKANSLLQTLTGTTSGCGATSWTTCSAFWPSRWWRPTSPTSSWTRLYSWKPWASWRSSPRPCWARRSSTATTRTSQRRAWGTGHVTASLLCCRLLSNRKSSPSQQSVRPPNTTSRDWRLHPEECCYLWPLSSEGRLVFECLGLDSPPPSLACAY